MPAATGESSPDFQEKNVNDAMDAYYKCIWDVNILEFLIYHHGKKGELEKKQLLVSGFYRYHSTVQ